MLLVRTPAGYELQNISAHGTALNGKLITDRVALHPGDELRLGERAVLVYDILTDDDRRATLVEKHPEAASRVVEARATPEKSSSTVLYVTIALLWIGAGVITFGSRALSAPRVEAPVGPFVAASLDFESTLPVDLRPDEASAIWSRIHATWERERAWKKSADHELVVQGARLLARSGQTVSGAPEIGAVVARTFEKLEQSVHDALVRAEQARAAGDRHAAHAAYRTILRQLTLTPQPLAIRSYALQRLQS